MLWWLPSGFQTGIEQVRYNVTVFLGKWYRFVVIDIKRGNEMVL
jgi:hypothetical protein